VSHPFGDLLLQFRARKPGLSQTRLAQMAGYDPAILARMCAGKKDLTGPSGRDRVVRVIEALHEEGALATLDEANALLAAADLPPLYDGLPVEASLARQLKAKTQQASADAIHVHHERPRHNLPTQLTSFIGRAAEVERVEHLLREKRMVTLTGAGGVGKTRLATEVGERTLDVFPDGIWLVDLAPLHDPALVARAICATFDLPERPERSDLQMVLTFLGHKRMLLILDNCEHLIAACAALAAHVLRACPHVGILATSREPLRISGEMPWRVQSLTTPDPATSLTPADLVNYEAARLFIERTRDAQPGFEVTPQHAGAITEVCHRLDGIPLALEMAAAQTGVMTLEEIAARLDDRFSLLTNGARTALPRHRTLRAIQEWSYDLLSPAERRLLARLSVFTGGWTAEAAEAVYGEREAVALLVQLVHKSLVVAEPRGVHTRYRLLETVRQFAAEKLEAMGEAEAARRRHCDYFTALVETFEPTLIGPRLKAWCDQVHADWSNIRAAVGWARLQPDGGVRLARIAGSLWHYWTKRGSGREIKAWLQEAIARTTEADGLPRARALVAFAVSQFVWLFADRPNERAMVAESLRISQRANDATGVAYALTWSGGFTDMHAGTRESHIAPIECALTMFRQAGQLFGVGDALRTLALTYTHLGDEANAARVLEQSALWCYETGETLTVFNSLNYLSTFNVRRAIELGELVLAKQRASGDAEGVAAVLQVLGRIHFKHGNYAEAKRALEECHARWQTLGRLWSLEGGTARCLWDLGPVLGFLGEGKRGAKVLLQAQAEYDQAGDDHGVAWAVYFRGQVLFLNGDVADAEQEMRKSATLLLSQGDLFGAALALCKIGEIALLRGDLQRALRLIGATINREPNLHLHDVPPPWREAHERTLAYGRAHSDDAAFIEGQNMTIEQAVAYAVNGN
jgi:non-specific serine/threonine protein kinase